MSVKPTDTAPAIASALEIVLDLAEQNVIADPDMADERRRQQAAIRRVRRFLANIQRPMD